MIVFPVHYVFGFEGISLVVRRIQTAGGFFKEEGGLLLGPELVQDWMYVV
ncbi:MAG: hypothetical protein CM1200mP30_30400 [Pseudomonadota bacterium]|nr:MAG: hypothetical protein CM1200mP30_30400 [Pseudomonadota bacterium]